MPDDTLRDFLVSIGYKIDEANQKKFNDGLEGTLVKANLLSAAIEGLAKTAYDKIGQVGQSFEDLYRQSQRSEASVQGIIAFKNAVAQTGGTAEAAGESIENFGKFLRTPIPRQFIEGTLGIKTAINGVNVETTQLLTNIGAALAGKPKYIQDQFLAMTKGILDYRTLLATQQPDFAGRYGAELRSVQQSGITDKIAKDITGIDQNLTLIDQHFNTMVAGAEGKFELAFQKPIERFKDWLVANEPIIDSTLGKIITKMSQTDWMPHLRYVPPEQALRGGEEGAKRIGGWLSQAWEWLKKAVVSPASGSQGGPPSQPSSGSQGGPPSQIDGVAPTVNGVPVSSGNPLPVTISSDSGGFLSGLMNSLGLGGMFGGGTGGAGGAGGRGGALGPGFAGEKSVGGWWTPARMKYATDRLMKEGGLSETGAAGLVARWAAVEAPGGPGSINPSSGAYGIAQWLGDRRPGHPESFDEQLTRAIREGQGREQRAWAALQNARTPEDAARGASMFERAEGYNAATGHDAYTNATPVAKVLAAIRAATGSVVANPPKSVFPAVTAPGGDAPDLAGTPPSEHANPDLAGPARPGPAAGTPPKPLFPVVTAPGGIRIGAPPAGTPPSGMHANPLQFLPPNAGPLHDRPAVGGGGGGNVATANQTNNITVSAPDPNTAAAMVGLHLDRSGNDLTRNLQGAFQ
jgi:hypothetical protein